MFLGTDENNIHSRHYLSYRISAGEVLSEKFHEGLNSYLSNLKILSSTINLWMYGGASTADIASHPIRLFARDRNGSGPQNKKTSLFTKNSGERYIDKFIVGL